jgi:hypothetical protein
MRTSTNAAGHAGLGAVDDDDAQNECPAAHHRSYAQPIEGAIGRLEGNSTAAIPASR